MNQVAPKNTDPNRTEHTTLLEEFAKLGVHRLVRKHSKETIVTLAKEHGVATAGLSTTALVSAIKALLSKNEMRNDPAYQRHLQSAGSPLIDPTVPQYGVRCVYCGEVAMVIQPGFNALRPTNLLGKPIPVHFWPFQFRGPEHIDPTELASRSREVPVCAFCDREIAVTGITERGATGILPRALVELAPAKPEEEMTSTSSKQ